jgi:polysaccharide pyruvyl transferase WcaK-like protein
MRRPENGTVAFFGSFNSTNFGNECTLKAVIFHFRKTYPGTKFICITDGHKSAARSEDIEAVPVSPELLEAWKARTPLGRLVRRAVIGLPAEIYRFISGIMALRRARMLIVPGTGLLTDAFGLTGCGPYALFRWAIIARLCGCKLVFLSVGAGPLYSRLGRFFVKSALSLAAFRSYRDISSRQYLTSIGFEAERDPIYPDLAFSLPAPASPPADDRPSEVGLGVMAYLGNYSAAHPIASTDRDYWDNLARFSKWLIAEGYNVRPFIGDMVDAPARERFSRSLHEDVQPHRDGAIIDEPVTSFESLMPAIAATDVVVATRFHNILLSILSGKPVIAISFHHKCASLMASVGLSAYCLDTHGLDADALIRTFQLLIVNSKEVKAQIAQKVLEFRRELDDQYEKAFGTPADAPLKPKDIEPLVTAVGRPRPRAAGTPRSQVADHRSGAGTASDDTATALPRS